MFILKNGRHQRHSAVFAFLSAQDFLCVLLYLQAPPPFTQGTLRGMCWNHTDMKYLGVLYMVLSASHGTERGHITT